MFMYEFFVILALLTLNLEASEFDYEHQAKWYDQFQECSMNRQSPIEINSNEAKLSYDMAALNFVNYDTPYALPALCENNGHTANIQLPKPQEYMAAEWQIYDRASSYITGGSLPRGRFVAETMHFHWGSKDSHGSEHVIDSKRYAMEMHILHRNTKYQTVEEARENEDGLAVLAVLYAVDNNSTMDFPGLMDIIEALESTTDYHNISEISNFTLSKLFGDLELTEFYAYQGSLTTPPCSQAVSWTIFSHVVTISHVQMTRFHQLRDGHGALLENNYRALQAKGNRKVYFRRNQKANESFVEGPSF